VSQFIRDYFKTAASQTVRFKELRKAFSKRFGLSSRSAAGVLANSPNISVTMANSYLRMATYRPDSDSSTVKGPYQRKVPLQSDLIVAEAKKLLAGCPSGELPLVEVVKSIESKMGIKRVNVYSAISQCEEMEKIAVEGSAFKVLRLRGAKRMDFPQLHQIRSKDWQKECERGLAKLTVTDVDIGLFILGRQFDNAMKLLLQAAKDAGLPVLDGHMAKLNSRIDWAYNQGLFHDKPMLTFLRIERNERGHSPPTEQERRETMKYAPFIAGLYLDYLLMIEKHIEGYRTPKK
jgi:hypothetical protein